MKICRIARLYPRSTFPGSGLIAYKLSENLKYPCLYIAKKLPGDAFPFPEHVKAVFLEYPEPNFPRGYDIRKIRLVLLSMGKAFGNLVLIGKALRYVLQFKPDIVHLHTPLQVGLAILVKVLYRCPLVMTFHGTDYYRFEDNRALQAIVRWFVDFVVCITPDMLQDFQARMPGVPAIYLDNGVDLNLFVPPCNHHKKKKQIVSVGRLVWQKGYEHLVETAGAVLQEKSDYRFLIIGEGEARDALESLIREKRLSGKVLLLGNLSQREVVKHLQESEIFAMSSVTEGFPKALIEAMACGLPVVTTDAGACPQVAEDCGYVVRKESPNLMTEAILKLIDDPKLMDTYGHNAIHKAQQYDWKKMSDKMQQVYETLIAAR